MDIHSRRSVAFAGPSAGSGAGPRRFEERWPQDHPGSSYSKGYAKIRNLSSGTAAVTRRPNISIATSTGRSPRCGRVTTAT